MYFYIYVLVFAFVFLIVFCGALFYQSSKNKANGYEQFEINKKTLEYLQSQNFVASKIFYITDSHSFNKENSYKKMMVVDDESHKICLVDYLSKRYYIIGFEELLNYELYENGSMVTNGTALGGFGIGIFGAEANGNCKDLKLIIRIKNLSTPQVVYDILTNYMAGIGVDKTAPLYRQCITSLQEAISFLEVIKNNNLTSISSSNA